jgi:hypothetical protein
MDRLASALRDYENIRDKKDRLVLRYFIMAVMSAFLSGILIGATL